MSTKDCPSCGAEAPATAARCKECFHDFAEDKKSRAGMILGPLILLGTVAGVAFMGAMVLLFIFMQPVEERMLVDEGTRSVVWTTTYRTGIETERLMFDQITKVEHSGHGRVFQIVAVTASGDRKVLHEAKQPLGQEGRQYARLMDKPFEDVEPDAASKKH